jgi:hypothetical protein
MKSQLQPMNFSRRRGLLSKGVLVLHDDVHPDFMAAAVEPIGQLKF